jgi:hypothetical protein
VHRLRIALLAAATLPATLSAQTRPRTILLVGGGGMYGNYLVVEPDTGMGRNEAKHTYKVAGLTLEARRRIATALDGALRLSAFKGTDAGHRIRHTQAMSKPFPTRPPRYDTARKDVIEGVTAAATVDLRYVGVTAGIATGRWLYTYQFPIRDGTTSSAQRSPIFELRLGPVRGVQAEIGSGTHQPTFAPGPVVKYGLAYETPTAATWRLVRFGLSDEGLYVGGLRVLYDYEIEPYFTVGSSSMRQISISARYRM